MRPTLRLLLSLALFFAVAPLLAAEPERVLYFDLMSALQESGLDLAEPAELTPVDYGDGVATYRMRNFDKEGAAFALVAVPSNPLRSDPVALEVPRKAGAAPPAGTAPFQKMITLPTGRCNIQLWDQGNFGNGMYIPALVTNLDWNVYTGGSVPFNDRISSLKVGCDSILIFEHKNFGGSALFFPAFAQIPDLGVYNFNDKASSHLIYCQ